MVILKSLFKDNHDIVCFAHPFHSSSLWYVGAHFWSNKYYLAPTKHFFGEVGKIKGNSPFWYIPALGNVVIPGPTLTPHIALKYVQKSVIYGRLSIDCLKKLISTSFPLFFQ